MGSNRTEYARAYRAGISPAQRQIYYRNAAEKVKLRQPALKLENEWLVVCRTKFNLPQRVVAGWLGVSTATISRYENGTLAIQKRTKDALIRRFLALHQADKRGLSLQQEEET